MVNSRETAMRRDVFQQREANVGKSVRLLWRQADLFKVLCKSFISKPIAGLLGAMSALATVSALTTAVMLMGGFKLVRKAHWDRSFTEPLQRLHF